MNKTFRLICLAFTLFTLLILNAIPTGATSGYVGRIEVRGLVNNVLTTRVVYNGGWTSYRTSYFDLGDGNGVTIIVYPSGGSPSYSYYVRNNNGWNDSVISSASSENFYPWPPIEGTYRAYIDGNTPGDFYIRGYYPDLVASVPRPDDGAVSPPFCVNQAVDWYVTITNQGQGSATSTTVGYFLGTSSSDFSHEINTDGVSSLDPGEASEESDIYTFQTGDAGTRYLNVFADMDDESGEADENNNKNSYGPFQVLSVPGAVTLSSPSNGSSTCTTTPTFQWNAYSGATGYTIQIDNNSDFSSPERNVTFATPTTSYVPSPALSPNRWYWRVRAKNSCGDGTWSSSRYVDIIATPISPGLVSPLANASTCNTTPTFTWTEVTGASQYRIQIDDNTGFTSPLEVTRTSTDYTPSALAPGDYYWRVRAENACGVSTYSAYRKLTISGPPATPALSAPSSGTESCSLLPTFSWDSVANATGYLLQVDNNSDFSSPEINESNLISTSYTPLGDLDPGQYYWRVAAQGTCGNSPWSYPSWTLDLIDIPPAPALSAPAADAELCSLAPTFSWVESFQTTGYQFQLATSSTFSSPTIDESVAGLRYTASLDPGYYYWRVRGTNQCGDGPWATYRAIGLHDPVITADFEASPTEGNLPLSVNFTSLSSGDIDTYDWSFGTGDTSNQIGPSYTYDQEGYYTVSLTVSGFCGSDNAQKQDYIHVTDVPVQIYDVRESNVRDTSFTISWLTDVASGGYIEYGLTTDLGISNQDTRGESYSGQTHYVQVSGVQAGTTYYYDVISGNTRDDNDGQHYTLTTGPTLVSIPPSDTVYGQVFVDGGTTASLNTTSDPEGAIVYLTLNDKDQNGSPGSSALMSALVDEFGYWSANLGNARLANLSESFSYSPAGDEVYLYGNGGSLGTDCIFVDTANDSPAEALILGTGCPMGEGYEIYLPLILKTGSSSTPPTSEDVNRPLPVTAEGVLALGLPAAFVFIIRKKWESGPTAE